MKIYKQQFKDLVIRMMATSPMDPPSGEVEAMIENEFKNLRMFVATLDKVNQYPGTFGKPTKNPKITITDNRTHNS